MTPDSPESPQAGRSADLANLAALVRDGLTALRGAVEAGRAGGEGSLEAAPAIGEVLGRTRGMLEQLFVRPEVQQFLVSVATGERRLPDPTTFLASAGLAGAVPAMPLPEQPVQPEQPERAPERRQSPEQRIEAAATQIRQRMAPILNGEVGRLMTAAQELHRTNPTAYHNSIRWIRGAPEAHGSQFLEAHLAPTVRPRPLVIMVMGNRDPNGEPDPSRKVKGLNRMFDTLATQHADEADVLKFRVGNILSLSANMHPELAYLHMRQTVEDALAGRGIFAGRQYTSVSFVGFSHGAGAVDRFLREGGVPVPVASTTYIDGITYRGTSALTQRPSHGGAHFHAFQTTRTVAYPVRGFPAAGLRAGDRQLEIPGVNHSTVHNLVGNATVANLYQTELMNFLLGGMRRAPGARAAA